MLWAAMSGLERAIQGCVVTEKEFGDFLCQLGFRLRGRMESDVVQRLQIHAEGGLVRRPALLAFESELVVLEIRLVVRCLQADEFPHQDPGQAPLTIPKHAWIRTQEQSPVVSDAETGIPGSGEYPSLVVVECDVELMTGMDSPHDERVVQQRAPAARAENAA